MVSKLENSLAAARNTDVQQLAKIVATSNQLGPAQDENGSAPTLENDPNKVLYQRIMAAKCVLEKVDEIRKEVKELQTRASRQAARLEKQALKADEDTEDGSNKKRKAAEKEKPIDDAALQALQKLKERGAQHTGGTDLSNSDVSEDSGIISDGDLNDLSDLDEDDQGNIDNKGSKKIHSKHGKDAKSKKKPKVKNRLGQRARRRLAEQVHGNAAAHLKAMEREARLKREEDTRRRQSRKEKPPHAAPQTKQRQLENEPAESLHPSWAAKKKQMEAQKKQLFAAQGTKVTFNDDD